GGEAQAQERLSRTRAAARGLLGALARSIRARSRRAASASLGRGVRAWLGGLVVPVKRNGAKRPEAFPSHALRVGHPILVRLGVTAVRAFLRYHAGVGLLQVGAKPLQFLFGFGLHAEMVDATRAPSLRDREVYPRVVQHPFRVIGLR